MESLLDLIKERPLESFILGLWIILLFTNPKGGSKFFENAFSLLTQPTNLDIYPKAGFDRMGAAFKLMIGDPLTEVMKQLGKYIQNTITNYSWKIFGQFLIFIFLCAFFVADAIVIANVSQVIGYPLQGLPPSLEVILADYGLAITIGSFLTLVLGGLLIFSLERSEFLDLSNYPPTRRKLVQMVSWFLLLSSLFVGVFLGFAAVGVTVSLPEWVSVIQLISVNVLVRVNVLLGTLLVFEEGIKGIIRMISLLISSSLLTLLAVIFIGFTLITGLGQLLLDLFIRFLLLIVYTFIFLIYSPFHRTLNAPGDFFKFLISLFRPGSLPPPTLP